MKREELERELKCEFINSGDKRREHLFAALLDEVPFDTLVGLYGREKEVLR